MGHNQTEWSDERLQERADELDALALIPHGEARQAEIQHEIDCIAFEIGQRIVETINKPGEVHEQVL